MNSKKKGQRPHFGYGDPETTIAERLASAVTEAQHRRQMAEFLRCVDEAKQTHCRCCAFSLYCLMDRLPRDTTACTMCRHLVIKSMDIIVDCSGVWEKFLKGHYAARYSWMNACMLCKRDYEIPKGVTIIKGFFIVPPVRDIDNYTRKIQLVEEDIARRKKTGLP